jgi:hypothetical protein
MSAAKGFVGGVAVTAPMTALVMYLVLGQQAAVETRLERHEVRQEITRVEREESFDAAWEAMTGTDTSVCTPARTAQLTVLRDRLGALDAQLATNTAASAADREALAEALRALEHVE